MAEKSRIKLGGGDCAPDCAPDCASKTPNPDCRCHAAVCKAYNGMRRCGVADADSLYAALRVYRHHHPEISAPLARQTVEAWVHYASMH